MKVEMYLERERCRREEKMKINVRDKGKSKYLISVYKNVNETYSL